MGASNSTNNNPTNNNNPPPGPDPRTVNLNHLTENPTYQTFLRQIYTNNSQVPFIPGSFVMEHMGYDTILNPPDIHIKKTSPVTNDFHVDKATLQLVKDEVDNNSYHITFKFNAKSDGEVYIYFDAKEVLDDEKNIQLIVNETKPGLESKVHYFQAGKGQISPQISNRIDLKNVGEDRMTKVIEDKYPFIIELSNKTEHAITKKRLYLYCALIKGSNDVMGVKLLKQKFHFKGRTYELLNVFDNAEESKADENREDKECVVCFTNKIDTFVLPCNHLCLCSQCSKDLKSHNNFRCPMCRRNIESFLKMEKKKKKEVKATEIRK
jgi:DNA-directed RNA polymerase subunit RPC12/RpoP